MNLLDFLIDELIERIIRKGERIAAQDKVFSEEEIVFICEEGQKTLERQPCLIDVSPPVVICGDLQGDFFGLLSIFDRCGYPPLTKYLFLGSYVDRGKRSIDTITLLLLLTIKYPSKVLLLRGNHEVPEINRICGFYDEIKRKYSIRLWKTFNQVFSYLSLAGLIGNQIFCVHGGLSSELNSISLLRNIRKPVSIGDNGLTTDILFSSPEHLVGKWSNNNVGVEFNFGELAVEEFVMTNNLKLIVRSKSCVTEGFEYFAGQLLVTIFSSKNHLGVFNNPACVMRVDSGLEHEFITFS
jgi:serine/threonine-protein phosphatase PP1 catalytic subunit